MNNNERLYKTMRNSGAGAVAMGIVIATVGLTVGSFSCWRFYDKTYNKTPEDGLGAVFNVPGSAGVFSVFC